MTIVIGPGETGRGSHNIARIKTSPGSNSEEREATTGRHGRCGRRRMTNPQDIFNLCRFNGGRHHGMGNIALINATAFAACRDSLLLQPTVAIFDSGDVVD
ncbi:MAG TPA: hypothetical protein VF210_16275 [Pseudomonadales bacterium]